MEHTDAVHEHTDAVHDAAVEASSRQRMSYTSAAETQTEGFLRCAEAIELDTDVVAGKLDTDVVAGKALGYRLGVIELDTDVVAGK